jgi:Poly(A) polymerase nucleotidyltransferase domain
MIPDKLDLLDINLLKNLDDQSVRSLNGKTREMRRDTEKRSSTHLLHQRIWLICASLCSRTPLRTYCDYAVRSV